MKTIGIIAEYNPFHNGHAYQIAEIKKRTGADHIVVAMSGDFVQRGAPALLDKYARAQMALSCGADLVLELPVLWSTASAENFAMAGVTLFDKMGCVDGICFGAETDDLPLLSAVADILAEEPEDYQKLLAAGLKNGSAFPKARAEALCSMPAASFFLPKPLATDDSSLLGQDISPGQAAAPLSEVLMNPNNILALEYLKALKRRRSSIRPLLLKREGAGYHDVQVDGCDDKPAASATALRRLLLAAPYILANETGDPLFSVRDSDPSAIPSATWDKTDAILRAAMPPEAYAILCHYQKNNPLLREDDFSSILGYLLLRHTGKDFASVADANADIANRMQKNRFQFDSFSGFCAKNKSRDITYTRMSRILTHLLLGLTNEDYHIGKELDYIPYLRILGFRRDSSALLRQLKPCTAVPLISKLADARKNIEPGALSLLEQDIFAADLYEQVEYIKSTRYKEKSDVNFTAQKKTTPRNEYARGIVLL